MFLGFIETISQWNVITGLCIAILALACMILAKPIANKKYPLPEEKVPQSVDGDDEVQPVVYTEEEKEQIKTVKNSRVNLTMVIKAIAGVCAILGCVLVMFINQ